jgi:hypothetical protein
MPLAKRAKPGAGLAEVVSFDEATGRGLIRAPGKENLLQLDLAKTIVQNEHYVSIGKGSRVDAVIDGANVRAITVKS